MKYPIGLGAKAFYIKYPIGLVLGFVGARALCMKDVVVCTKNSFEADEIYIQMTKSNMWMTNSSTYYIYPHKKPNTNTSVLVLNLLSRTVHHTFP